MLRNSLSSTVSDEARSQCVASTILPFIESGLQNHSFGILASGMGALLLERNYSGNPVLYVPSDLNFTGSQMNLYSASVVGSEIVGNTSAYSMWFGPANLALLPGSYSVTFEMSSSLAKPNTDYLITLQVTAESGAITFVSDRLTAENFTVASVFQNFTLNFTLPTYSYAMEFRGMFPSGLATITLKEVRLVQLQV